MHKKCKKKKAVTIAGPTAVLGIATVVVRKKNKSVYEGQPSEKNPLEGKRVKN